MSKLWVECQKCGKIFWVYASEFHIIYPKRSINYQLCGACENDSKSS